MPRKRKRERKEAMALRLADDSGRTLEECTRMTKEQIIDNLRDLGLTGRMQVELSTEEYNEGQSWEELIAAKAAAKSGKRKRDEPKASMAQRLAANSLSTLAECMDMTLEKINAKLKDLRCSVGGACNGQN